MNRRKGRVTEEEIHTLINLGQEEGLLVAQPKVQGS